MADADHLGMPRSASSRPKMPGASIRRRSLTPIGVARSPANIYARAQEAASRL